MIERMTARGFRARFNTVDKPVLVNHGIWFPQVSAQLMAIAEGEEDQPVKKEVIYRPSVEKTQTPEVQPNITPAVPGLDIPNTTAPQKKGTKMPDLSKSAQAKGRLGR